MPLAEEEGRGTDCGVLSGWAAIEEEVPCSLF